MKGLYLCLIVIVTVEAVRSQGPPTQTKKGKRPSRRNDNPDYGLPSGADIPDGRRGVAKPRKAAPTVVKGPPPSWVKTGRPPIKTARPAKKPAPKWLAAPAGKPMRPAGKPPGRPVRPVGKPPGKKIAGPPYTTRTRKGKPPANRGGYRNDNPDFGLPSGADWPDARRYHAPAAHVPVYGLAPPVHVPPPVYYPPAPPPVVSCDSKCNNQLTSWVCTTIGNEYENACKSNCRNEVIDCDGQCPCGDSSYSAPEPVAPVVPANPWAPADPCAMCQYEEESHVCVDDETTMYNECYARCEGKKISCTSTCPCSV